ncbi:MAG: hypothetical protein QOK42_2819 [Frankiaceae bacterium]|nr:hypothetical protein [Frankiaceae bacterium]
MAVVVTTVAERPHLREQMGGPRWDDAWPEFMDHDPVADLYYSDTTRWAKHILVATDGDEVIAKGYTIPFAFPTEQRQTLPDGGWDTVIRWGSSDYQLGVAPTACSALEITILPSYRGTGLSKTMVAAMRDMVAGLGFSDLYAPVRPSQKSREPDMPMSEYVDLWRDDGLPVDPWLRVHARLGGEIVAVCPTAMTITGTLAQWRAWTGLPFDQSGPVVVPGALVPVHVDVPNDHAVYVEPNVWMRHRLTP